uniref:Uncharacterized protein n=1 Tax=Pseudomonas syringae pv. actinidiae TaxID=103796 RepID=A0A2P0QEN1_PSESF|nr:hypothetical protein [Pseudomonas syringae pv. actinidiae]
MLTAPTGQFYQVLLLLADSGNYRIQENLQALLQSTRCMSPVRAPRKKG